jgi:hypothetical protein
MSSDSRVLAPGFPLYIVWHEGVTWEAYVSLAIAVVLDNDLDNENDVLEYVLVGDDLRTRVGYELVMQVFADPRAANTYAEDMTTCWQAQARQTRRG